MHRRQDFFLVKRMRRRQNLWKKMGRSFLKESSCIFCLVDVVCHNYLQITSQNLLCLSKGLMNSWINLLPDLSQKLAYHTRLATVLYVRACRHCEISRRSARR